MQIVVNNSKRSEEIDFRERVLLKMKLQIQKKIGRVSQGVVVSGTVCNGKVRRDLER